MTFGFDPFPMPSDLAVGADQYGGPNNTHGDFPVHVFLTPGAVLLHGLVIRVREKSNLEFVLTDEVLVAFDRIRAAPVDLSLIHI